MLFSHLYERSKDVYFLRQEFFVFFFFLRMIVTWSTVFALGTAVRLWSSQADNTLFLYTRRHKLSCFLRSQYVWNCWEYKSSASSACGGHGGEPNCKKHWTRDSFDVLTEGVSFSSDLSLSPCSKNSLVTNSATWDRRQIEKIDLGLQLSLIIIIILSANYVLNLSINCLNYKMSEN